MSYKNEFQLTGTVVELRKNEPGERHPNRTCNLEVKKKLPDGNFAVTNFILGVACEGSDLLKVGAVVDVVGKYEIKKNNRHWMRCTKIEVVREPDSSTPQVSVESTSRADRLSQEELEDYARWASGGK